MPDAKTHVQISPQASVGCSLACNEEVASQLVYMVFLQLIDHDPICI